VPSIEGVFIRRKQMFLLRREEGQGLAEYALILALIAIVAILALTFLGTQISSILSDIGVAI
jgi:pilus assembly protein Flp/PilA